MKNKWKMWTGFAAVIFLLASYSRQREFRRPFHYGLSPYGAEGF